MKDKPPSFSAHLGSILPLPFMVTLVIPTCIYYFTQGNSLIGMSSLPHSIALPIGIILLTIGLILLITTIRLFHLIGKGTLAPWTPTQKLVVAGPYRYVRNPMISGVVFILVGESFLLRSDYIFLWGAFFFTVNYIYFIVKEEPGLERRFGEEYREFKKNVPRWIPRLRPWEK